MKMLFNAFAKKLFGAKYNTLLRTFLVNFILGTAYNGVACADCAVYFLFNGNDL